MRRCKFSAVFAWAVISLVAWALPRYDPHDPIDLNFGILEALTHIERASICHAGDGEADLFSSTETTETEET